ncbi:uncharacterized protein LOC127288735 [Leptopilina boulardi]|uniref:uncharacterized protein LOC127288735 n=1 Tax=Leptopilina boulardi TaxID=63433 RepID=UPI0021F53D0E|nr:uncharacterized protein LOC127288735 [Leptopilina boulardi]
MEIDKDLLILTTQPEEQPLAKSREEPSCSKSNCEIKESLKRSKSSTKLKAKRIRQWAESEEVKKINVLELLNSTAKGRSVIKYYKESKLINSQCRSEIVRIVGDKLLNLKQNPSRDDFEEVDKKIRQVFPSESEFVYFIRAKTNGIYQRNHEGKLPNYIRNQKYYCRKLETSAEIIQNDFNETSSDEEVSENSDKISIDERNADGWLKEHLEPWEDVLKYWKLTHHLRTKKLTSEINSDQIYKYFEEYKILRLVSGYILLQIDFALQYPNSENSLNNDWEIKREALIKLISLECKTDEVREILSRLSKLTNEEKDNLVFQCIPDLFGNEPRKRGKGKSVTPRATVAESKEAFILHVTTANDINPAISRRLNQMKIGSTLQPFVLVVGATRAKLSRYYCVIDTVKYDFTSLKEAFDTCFKAIFALNSKYSSEAYSSWLFVQQAFYEITTIYDRKSSNVSTMTGNFQTLLKLEKTKTLES